VSSLVTSAAFIWLLPVRGEGSAVHYVRREADKPMTQAALCGSKGRPDKYNRERFRTARHAPASAKVCNACFAEACSFPTRVDWS
jgi:hypothetical protein